MAIYDQLAVIIRIHVGKFVSTQLHIDLCLRTDFVE